MSIARRQTYCDDLRIAEKIKGVNRVEYAFFIILFVGMITLVKGFTQPIFFIPSVLLFACAYFVYRKDEKRSLERERKIESLKGEYGDYFALPDLNKVHLTAYLKGIPSVDSSIKQVDELLEDVGLTILDPRLYFWVEEGHLKYQLSLIHDDFLFPNLNQLDYVEDGLSSLAENGIEIPSADIHPNDVLLFSRFGDLFVEEEGGGYRLRGDVAEGIITGEMAIPIENGEEIWDGGEEKEKEKEEEEEGERIVLLFKDNNEVIIALFASKDFDIFQKLIPDKELNMLIAARTIQGRLIDEKTDISQRIKILEDLKSKKLITEEEFGERKKLLLDRLTE